METQIEVCRITNSGTLDSNILPSLKTSKSLHSSYTDVRHHQASMITCLHQPEILSPPFLPHLQMLVVAGAMYILHDFLETLAVLLLMNPTL
ncbi:hypothetical protein C8R42DRAFT_686315 [Lentinula raphanica]|nr:hypothetical protein C8R42DRAFT_686315 [Lentinula raphanica]